MLSLMSMSHLHSKNNVEICPMSLHVHVVVNTHVALLKRYAHVANF